MKWQILSEVNVFGYRYWMAVDPLSKFPHAAHYTATWDEAVDHMLIIERERWRARQDAYAYPQFYLAGLPT